MTPTSTGYATLAMDSYRSPLPTDVVRIDGADYTIFATADHGKTGFQATAYQRVNSSDIVIAYRGTEFDREPVHDGGVDAGMVLLGINAQAPDSIAFTREVIEKARNDARLNDREANVTVTGHSLGGTLAEINAAKFGLKGETFNAYGAGSLFGTPSGGNQVIDHVRAGDVVSAASPHFGQVRTYAAEKDIATLSHAGYRDDSGALSLRNPIKAIDFDAHAIDNFIPESKLLGHSIISPESQARYRAHEGMIDRYRDDVMGIRKGLSSAWEVPKSVAEEAYTAGHAVGEKVNAGIHSVERGIEHAAHDVQETYRHARDDVTRGVHAIEEKAHGAWGTITHPGSWFDNAKPSAKLDDPAHPDHAMFKQAQSAVHQIDRDHGRTPDHVSDQISGAVVVSARRDGLDRIDAAVLSDDKSRIYGVQGSLESPHKRVTEVPTEQASRTTVEESSQDWQRVAQQAQQHRLSQTAQIPLPLPPERPGPSPAV